MTSTPEPLDRFEQIASRATAFRTELMAFLKGPDAAERWASILAQSPGWAESVEPLHRFSSRERAELMVAAELEHLDDDMTFAVTREAQRAIKPVVVDTSWNAAVVQGATTLVPRGLMYFHRPVAFDAFVPIVGASWGPVPAGGEGVHVTGWGQIPPGTTMPFTGKEYSGLWPCVDAVIGVLPDAVDRRLMAGAHLEYPATRFLRTLTAAWYGVKTDGLTHQFSYESGGRVVVVDEAAAADTPTAITDWMGELWSYIERGGEFLDIDSVDPEWTRRQDS